jgi:hypothetical protein
MPFGNHNSIPTSDPALLSARTCPKCGAEMEAIDTEPDGPALEHLHLCPGCYLVLWFDEAGLQLRQGVPMKKDTGPFPEPTPFTAEPRKC